MLDLSKRSRSGKFRLVTKFKKEKNNKNREARSSLGAPGTCPRCSPGARAVLSPWAACTSPSSRGHGLWSRPAPSRLWL